MSPSLGPAGLVRPVLVQPLRRDLAAEVDVFGAGRVVRSLMTVAALSGDGRRFRIWCRHPARAELLRVHLADLPPLDVEIALSADPPADGAGPLVLALGSRTSVRSRQARKDALFAGNMALIETLGVALSGRAVIVVTNPCTMIAARLAEAGVAACGIGLMNDQLRFEREAGDDLRLVGAHNPFELAFGRLGDRPVDDALAFPRDAYRDLTNTQDRRRPALDPDGLLGRTLAGAHQAAWRELSAYHDSLDPARRWYARQRIASRYLENGVACGRSILLACDMLSGRPVERPDVTLETPLDLPGIGRAMLGWPLDSLTGRPRRLAFGRAGMETLAAVAGRYRLGEPAGHAARRLVSAAGLSLDCEGDGIEAPIEDCVPLAADVSGSAPSAGGADIAIAVTDHPGALMARLPPGLGPPLSIAQHRGKNPFEHRDLEISALPGGRRLVRFVTSGAVALVDDLSRQIELAAPAGPPRHDELRKLLRDQLLTQAHAAAGALVLHAGLVRVEGVNLLLLGGSGAGKTTAALHLLCGGRGDYGASERVLLYRDGPRIVALGVPESLTIFPGSLRGLAPFEPLLAGRDPAEDWLRERKLRLSRDEVVSALGSRQMIEPAPIDRLVVLSYAPDAPGEAAIVSGLSPADIGAALMENDLTTSDDVRAEWLGWHRPASDSGLVPLAAGSIASARLSWRRPMALATGIARLARSK